jgi:hypothetical protein
MKRLGMPLGTLSKKLAVAVQAAPFFATVPDAAAVRLS